MQKRDSRSILLMLVLEVVVVTEELRAMGSYPFFRRNGNQSFKPIVKKDSDYEQCGAMWRREV